MVAKYCVFLRRARDRIANGQWVQGSAHYQGATRRVPLLHVGVHRL